MSTPLTIEDALDAGIASVLMATLATLGYIAWSARRGDLDRYNALWSGRGIRTVSPSQEGAVTDWDFEQTRRR